MGKDSRIEWTDHTFNPWIGCTKVSPGCLNCYAETLMDTRYGRVKWGAGNPRRRTSAANWKLPLKWNREESSKVGTHEEFVSYRRPRVFCASLADWLDDEVPVEWLADLLHLIRRTPNLDWLLLTKRPHNWKKRLDDVVTFEPMPDAEDCWPDSPRTLSDWIIDWYNNDVPANVWIGTTVEDQQRADERIPELLEIPARIRFLSCEPLLEEIELEPVWIGGYRSCAGLVPRTIDWVICGGESGPHARAMSAEWARSLRDQCAAFQVPFLFKQWGEWAPTGQITLAGPIMAKVGKHEAGRLLDGQTHDALPCHR